METNSIERKQNGVEEDGKGPSNKTEPIIANRSRNEQEQEQCFSRQRQTKETNQNFFSIRFLQK
jgi:hypothetical protein